MLVHPGGDAAILIWLFGRKTVEDNPVMVGSLDEMNLKQPGIGDLVHGDVDGPFDWHETLARVVEMIPISVARSPFRRNSPL